MMFQSDCANRSAHRRRCGQTRESALQKCKPNSEKRACFFLLSAMGRRRQITSQWRRNPSLPFGDTPFLSLLLIYAIILASESVCVCRSLAHFICVGETPVPVQTHHIIIVVGKRARGASPLYFGPVAPKIGTRRGKAEKRRRPLLSSTHTRIIMHFSRCQLTNRSRELHKIEHARGWCPAQFLCSTLAFQNGAGG